jgi:hypothetical protein
MWRAATTDGAADLYTVAVAQCYPCTDSYPVADR